MFTRRYNNYNYDKDDLAARDEREAYFENHEVPEGMHLIPNGDWNLKERSELRGLFKCLVEEEQYTKEMALEELSEMYSIPSEQLEYLLLYDEEQEEE